MSWWRRLVRRDDYEHRARRLDMLESVSDETIRKAQRATAENKQLAEVVRNTVKALRAEHDRR